MLFYDFQWGTKSIRVPAAAAIVVKSDNGKFHVALIGETDAHVGWDLDYMPRLVDLTGGGEAPMGNPAQFVSGFTIERSAPVPPTGDCLTREDGECVAEGTCMHTPGALVPQDAPRDETGCPLPTCSECGAYHEVVRPGKTQPTCLCASYRFECEKNKDLEERVEAQAKMLARLHEAAVARQRIVAAYRAEEPDVERFDLDASGYLSLTETSGFEADLDKHDKRFLVDLANAALAETRGE